MRKLSGSCFCGGIRYEITGELRGALNCHCSDCRKAHGAAFRSRASVSTDDFRFLAGEHLLKEYRAKPGEARCFCSVCGSQIFTRFDGLDHLGFALGTLDSDPGIRPEQHVWVSNKAPWHEITDDLPRHEEGLPITGGEDG